jgi:O-antigen/teichoic acid export membrane protein
MFSKWADTVMLGYFRTTKEVGVYNAALPTAMLLLMVPNALLSIFLPVITSEHAKRRMDSIRILYITIVKWIGLLGLPILFIMSIFSSPILIKFFGLEYASGGTSLIILSIGYFIFTLFWPASHLIAMIKKTQISFFISLSATSTNILLNWFLIPIYGINGAAIATASSTALNGILYGYFAHRYLKITPFDRLIIYR